MNVILGNIERMKLNIPVDMKIFKISEMKATCGEFFYLHHYSNESSEKEKIYL